MKLQELRKNNEVTQEELAKLLGVTQSAVSFWELERNGLPVNVAKKVADLFGIEWWRLYE